MMTHIKEKLWNHAVSPEVNVIAPKEPIKGQGLYHTQQHASSIALPAYTASHTALAPLHCTNNHKTVSPIGLVLANQCACGHREGACRYISRSSPSRQRKTPLLTNTDRTRAPRCVECCGDWPAGGSTAAGRPGRSAAS